MRIFPSDSATGWDIWHVRRCCEPTDVLWVDNETAQWAQLQFGPLTMDVVVHQARRILIFPLTRLVLIDAVRESDAVIARASRR